jgi:hypothetical protein
LKAKKNDEDEPLEGWDKEIIDSEPEEIIHKEITPEESDD